MFQSNRFARYALVLATLPFLAAIFQKHGGIQSDPPVISAGSSLASSKSSGAFTSGQPVPLHSGGGTAASLGCISTEAGLQTAMAGGTDAVLCAGITLSLHQPLKFTRSGQKLYTAGKPTGADRATLMIAPEATALTTLIDTEPTQTTTTFLDSIAIENLIIDGNGDKLGVVTSCPYPDGCRGLVNLGAVTNPIVSQNEIRRARTWSHLVLTDNFGGCSGGQITGNVIGPAIPTGKFAFTDGISNNCDGTTISGNQIFDVTDVGIVVFARPNVKVTGNTITAIHNHMNGALSATDYIQGHGNFTGTVFSDNIINSAPTEGGYIFVGVAAGNHTWFGTAYDNSQPKYNYGATITNNQLNGPGIGIGIAVSGINGFNINGNSLNATNMAVDPANVTSSSLQSGYATVGAGTLDSAVLREFYILRMYKNFLGVGAPDSGGFLYWMAALSGCKKERAIQVTRDFVGSSAAHLNALSPTAAANTLYRVILHREGDTTGLAFWAANISRSPTLAQGVQNAVSAFFRSTEYSNISNGMCPYSRNNE